MAAVPVLFAWTRYVSEPAVTRRSRALGLTAETAPRLAGRDFVSQMLASGILQAWVRHRTGRWPRASASSALATSVIRELQLHRDWAAAYRRSIANLEQSRSAGAGP